MVDIIRPKKRRIGGSRITGGAAIAERSRRIRESRGTENLRGVEISGPTPAPRPIRQAKPKVSQGVLSGLGVSALDRRAAGRISPGETPSRQFARRREERLALERIDAPRAITESVEPSRTEAGRVSGDIRPSLLPSFSVSGAKGRGGRGGGRRIKGAREAGEVSPVATGEEERLQRRLTQLGGAADPSAVKQRGRIEKQLRGIKEQREAGRLQQIETETAGIQTETGLTAARETQRRTELGPEARFREDIGREVAKEDILTQEKQRRLEESEEAKAFRAQERGLVLEEFDAQGRATFGLPKGEELTTLEKIGIGIKGINEITKETGREFKLSTSSKGEVQFEEIIPKAPKKAAVETAAQIETRRSSLLTNLSKVTTAIGESDDDRANLRILKKQRIQVLSELRKISERQKGGPAGRPFITPETELEL